jgi:adenosine tuberculosinyltransferase
VNSAEFQALPAAEVAARVREAGPKVCVFPINGTRRWFLLEHPPQPDADVLGVYLAAVEQRHVDLYRLFFDHGVHTLLTPAFGPDLLERGDDYIQIAADGLSRLTTEDFFLDFYREYGVRVRFYGDYRKYFGATRFAYLCDQFDELAERTASHTQHRLFFGLFANDAAETIAALSVDYYRQHGRTPDKHTLVELYYGEYVPPVDLFIGFDRFSAFDMPLVATGNEDLYFTVSPSPYLTAVQLRAILYDHMIARRTAETDYSTLEPDEWALMRDFYRANIGKTLGVGARQKHGDYWYPLPLVELPKGFTG